MPRSIAIIPARGGSKRIPRKNIRLFRGRPIIEWSIRAALESAAFDVVMVSTDDAEIADVATDAGAEVPFLRSSENADDHATTAAVMREVLFAYERHDRLFDLACSLYPTAPFVQPMDLARGKDVLRQGSFDAVLAITAFPHPIERSFGIEPNGRIRFRFPEHLTTRSQDLPAAFHDAGQWCWFRTQTFFHAGSLFAQRTGSVVIPSDRVQDIDTEADWRIAEAKHAALFPAT